MEITKTKPPLRRRQANRLEGRGTILAKSVLLPGNARVGGLIYLIACLPTRLVYVGSTAKGVRRWVQHRSDLRAGRHATHALQASFDTHGEAAHVFVPVEQGVDLNLLHPREQFWIWRFEGRTLNSWNGLSIRNRVATGWFADSLKNVPTAHLIAELASRGLYVTP